VTSGGSLFSAIRSEGFMTRLPALTCGELPSRGPASAGPDPRSKRSNSFHGPRRPRDRPVAGRRRALDRNDRGRCGKPSTPDAGRFAVPAQQPPPAAESSPLTPCPGFIDPVEGPEHETNEAEPRPGRSHGGRAQRPGIGFHESPPLALIRPRGPSRSNASRLAVIPARLRTCVARRFHWSLS
jgi:hypothetical protein